MPTFVRPDESVLISRSESDRLVIFDCKSRVVRGSRHWINPVGVELPLKQGHIERISGVAAWITRYLIHETGVSTIRLQEIVKRRAAGAIAHNQWGSFHGETDTAPLPWHTVVALDLDLLIQSDHIWRAASSCRLGKPIPGIARKVQSVVTSSSVPEKTGSIGFTKTAIDNSSSLIVRRIALLRCTSRICVAQHSVTLFDRRFVEDHFC